MSQEQLQRIQQLIQQGQFDEARALLGQIGTPQAQQLIQMVNQLEATAQQAAATTPPGAAPAGDDQPGGEDFSFSETDADLDRFTPEAEAFSFGAVDEDFGRFGQATPAEEAAPASPEPEQPPRRDQPVRTEADGTKVYHEGTYEMLWDCRYCGTTKNLGKTHRHCPNCGAAQDPKWRYFPSDDEKVAVEDHVFVGVDVICPSCDALNSAAASFCGNCGTALTEDAQRAQLQAEQSRAAGERFGETGPRDVVQDEFNAEMRRVGVQPDPAAARGGGIGSQLRTFAIIGVVIAAIIGAVAFLTRTEEKTFQVTGHSWERTISIQEYGPQPGSAWCDSMPVGAYSVSRQREIRRYEQVYDGQDCRTVRVDQGDGTFRQERRCTDRYRDEPVYDDRCYFTIDVWDDSRVARASGASREETPVWPEANLACANQSRIGCERESGRDEDYLLHLREIGGTATYECETPFDLWNGANIETSWTMEVRVNINQPVCDSLARAG